MRWQACTAVLCLLVLCQFSGAASAAEGAITNNTTQAGCACLQSWESTTDGSMQLGCQNPNSDPNGAWCAVDVNACPGFFGVTPGFNGDSIHFDYCGQVRERTKAGCLCQSVWSLPDGKKYKARCAHPNSPTERVCVANPATCPGHISAPQVQACDTPIVEDPSSATITANNCSCAAGWSWTYKQGGQQEFASCANPDGDPTGAWCQVDAMACNRFAGQVNVSDKVINFDYCTAIKPPVTAPGACAAEIPHYQQCGGKSNCTDWGCSDEPWAGACCAKADPQLMCTCQNQFYHQCLNSIDIEMLKNGSAVFDPPDSFIIIDKPVTETGAVSSPSPAQHTPGPNAASPSPAPAITVQQLPGTQVQLTLRIDYDFAKLAAVDAMTSFKSALVAWLTSIAGPPQYIYDVSVLRVYAGSVVADASLVFTANAPTSVVDATVAKLKSSGSELYTSSGLSGTYGSIVSFMMSTGPSVISNPPGTATSTSAAGGSVGTGAVAGIVVACVTVLAGAGFAVSRALSVRVAGDQDKSAQLAYMNELTEGEIAAEMAAAGKLRQEELKLEASDFAPNARSSSWLNEWLGELPTPNPNQVARHPSLAKTSFSIRTLPTSSAQHAALSHFSGGPPEYGSADGNSRMDVSDLAGGTPRSHISAEPSPDPAFLPLPDGETSAKGGGIAFASLKHRRISNSSQPMSPAANGGPAAGGGASREHGPQAVISHNLGTLSRLSSAVSQFVSGGGAPPQDEKKH